MSFDASAEWRAAAHATWARLEALRQRHAEEQRLLNGEWRAASAAAIDFAKELIAFRNLHAKVFGERGAHIDADTQWERVTLDPCTDTLSVYWSEYDEYDGRRTDEDVITFPLRYLFAAPPIWQQELLDAAKRERVQRTAEVRAQRKREAADAKEALERSERAQLAQLWKKYQ